MYNGRGLPTYQQWSEPPCSKGDPALTGSKVQSIWPSGLRSHAAHVGGSTANAHVCRALESEVAASSLQEPVQETQPSTEVLSAKDRFNGAKRSALGWLSSLASPWGRRGLANATPTEAVPSTFLAPRTCDTAPPSPCARQTADPVKINLPTKPNTSLQVTPSPYAASGTFVLSTCRHKACQQNANSASYRWGRKLSPLTGHAATSEEARGVCHLSSPKGHLPVLWVQPQGLPM